MALPACRTLEDVKKLKMDTIRPIDAGTVLGIAPYRLNCMARVENGLPFPYMWSGKRLVIMRKPFIDFVENGGRIPKISEMTGPVVRWMKEGYEDVL